MIHNHRFDVTELKRKSSKIRDWIRSHAVSRGLLFFIMGILSTIWFLVRVIPKPSRATYPCMRVAAPFMSGLVIYLLAVGGLTVASRKSKRKIVNVRYSASILLTFAVVITLAITPSDNKSASVMNIPVKTGPDDGPNQPFGTAMGIKPGRVIWDWDTAATNRNCMTYYF